MMNERMKELALQADLIWHKSAAINTKTEKFAELIVRDVLNLFGDERLQPCCQDAVTLLQSKITNHFGVER